MTVSLATVAAAFAANPILLLIIVLCLGATMVNGATDAPNAIATVVGTKAMAPTPAIIMAAICNFIGMVGITAVSTAVASTIFGMVDFGGDTHAALVALAAAMVAIIVWGVAAWAFGIPTSQSHSLIAGITGAAIALQGGLGGVNPDQWIKVVYGLVVSTGLGFGTGWLFTRLIKMTCSQMHRRRATKAFDWMQIAAGAGVAILHGAQDGQKFLSLCMLAVMLGIYGTTEMSAFPLWMVVLVSLTMSLGTAVGGRKIIKSVGMNMVRMETYQGFAACLAACFCIALATFTGIPVSTTHTKTTAIMGVGAEKSMRNVKWDLAGTMVLTWVLTFPGCGLIAYVFTYIFLLVL
ncbi:Low-affinity inorganic phosphate transporter 1 [Slackia heliotrinireducens]|uniref:Phosphate/sulfate permease n=1 Tax=Slackia heliotrinireducens (strain ATCC 29202 / DSM 20476 / NCTC 11029 / RHS 1) TaxID=471855 RepID=C7N7D5_SLAHD|nr:inorganic phosphate transporter [Slackia heliotrinireducens]ACV22820.1 phosphate/sulfate permease [Slackia heliotrinireducens DSM 20476]VEH01542.1 Low-affinity inorganic phosphate transporter 1 [Slackia heliotrinireducens]